MKKVDIEKITLALNGLRMKTGQRELTAKEANDLLASAGVGSNMRGPLSEKIFTRRSEGTKKFYTFKKEAIYGKLIDNVYDEFRSLKRKKTRSTSVLSEESAVELLKSLGYKMSKPVGLDKDRMKKDGMYEKYMLYKTI